MMILLLISTILSTVLPSVRSDFDVNKIRLKNGATVIYSPADWGNSSKVVGVFFKNGATLKFEKRTGLPALTQQMLSLKMKRLSKELGFRYRSYLTWDYLAYVLYLPSETSNDKISRIWAAMYDDSNSDVSDLNSSKKALVSSIKYDFEHKATASPMISFMARHNTIYSIGKYGNQEDVESITLSEFEQFKHCYINPNNSIIVSVPEININKFTKGIDAFKPCFRDDKFENEGTADLNIPGRIVTYLKSEKKNFIVRLGFPSSSCEKKENIVYDIIAELMEQDEVISSMSGHVRVENQCYLNNGVFEISFTEVKKDPDEIMAKLTQRLKFLSSDLDVSVLSLAKGELNRRFWDVLNSKESFVYLLAKSQMLSGNYENFLDYVKTVDEIKQPEVKEMLRNLSDGNMYKIYIKQE